VRKGALTLLAALAAAAALPGPAGAALTATDIRIGVHPAFVRIVVDFTGGRLRDRDILATDPNPFGGRAAVEVSKLGIDTDAGPESAHGVQARLVQHANRIVLRLRSKGHRFKYLAYDDLRSPERLVVDLWKARPPAADAEFPPAPQGGCLTIETFSVGRGTATATGEEHGLFEHMFGLGLRNAGGNRVRMVPVTSSGGNWSRTFSYSVGARQPGTLEAADFSAKDGSVVCIAQVRVTLKPT